MDARHFAYDEAELTAEQRAFADGLSHRARSWPVDPRDTGVDPAARTGDLIAWLSIVDAQRNLEVLLLGADVTGSTVRADKLHNQLFSLPEHATELAFTSAGTPAQLAERTADWFETILARRLVRCEWQHAQRTYAVRYEFADTGRGLIESFDETLAPQRIRTRLAQRRERGRITRAHLAQPDLVTRIRGTSEQFPA